MRGKSVSTNATLNPSASVKERSPGFVALKSTARSVTSFPAAVANVTLPVVTIPNPKASMVTPAVCVIAPSPFKVTLFNVLIPFPPVPLISKPSLSL